MAHFALVIDSTVEAVHVVNNAVITDEDGVEQEALGQAFLAALHGYNSDTLIQCSYNGNFRGAFPARGWIYDAEADEFIAPVIEAPED